MNDKTTTTVPVNHESLEQAVLNLKSISEALGMRVKVSFISYDPKN